jgi:Ca2+-binding EF-hand superfamily protein
MKLATSTLIGAAAFALALGSAYAAGKPKAGFDALDKNNDGVISKAEAAASPSLTKGFDAADKNNDGKVGRVEYRTWSASKPRERDPGFNNLDKNNDGYLTRAEARANSTLAKNFKTADRNNDGRLNRAEYLAVMTKKDLNTVKRKVDDKVDREPSASAGGSAVPPQ